MQDPAAGDGQSGLDRVEFTVGRIQGAGLALEQRALVEQPGALDPVRRVLRAHRDSLSAYSVSVRGLAPAPCRSKPDSAPA